MTRPVAPEGLRVVRDPSALPFHSTSEPCPPEGLIGQEREAGAMAFGVGMRHAGYNLFVLSAARTGKTSSMKRVLAQAAAREPAPADPCYVHNFADPYRPTALAMPFGRARELQEAMRRLVDECRTRLPRAFESEEFERQKSCIVEDLGAQQREEVARLEEAARSRRFTVLHGPGGLTLAPAPHGEPLTTMEYEALPAAMKETIREHSEVLEAHMEATHRRLRQLKRDARNAHERLVRDVAAAAVCPLFQELREQFAALPAVDQYLNDVEKDLVAHAEQLHGPDDGKLALPFLPPPGAFLDRYRVNVLVDRTGVVSAPVLLEPHPTHGNLVGRTEHRAYFGTLVTDFTLIRAGALHRATEGYLLLEAIDVLRNPLAWNALKKALKTGTIRIEDPLEDPLEEWRPAGAAGLAPEPIPLSVKVILIGSPFLYYLLSALDEDFHELFKVTVDFDDPLPRTPELELLYARFIGGACQEEVLVPFSAGGVAKLIEHCSRLVANQGRLTARLGNVIDLARRHGHEEGGRYGGFVEPRIPPHRSPPGA